MLGPDSVRLGEIKETRQSKNENYRIRSIRQHHDLVYIHCSICERICFARLWLV